MKSIIRQLKRKFAFRRARKKKRSLSYKGSRRKSRLKVFGQSLSKKIGIFILVVITGIGLYFFARFVYQVVTFKPQTDYRDDIEIEEKWKGEGRLAILLVGLDRREGKFAFVDAVSILFIEPEQKSLGIFNLDPDSVVEWQFKDIPLRYLYNEALLADSVPINVIQSEVEELIAVEITRYVVIDESGFINLAEALGGAYMDISKDLVDRDIKNSGGVIVQKGSRRLGGEDLLSYVRADEDGVASKLVRQIDTLEAVMKRSTGFYSLLRVPDIIDVFSRDVRTNISKSEMWYLYRNINNFEKIKRNYSHGSSFSTSLTIESKTYRYPNIKVLDEDIQEVSIIEPVTKEQARVEVYNSTNERGLASWQARWLRNLGIDVIRVGDSSEKYDKTTIFIRDVDKDYSETLKAIKTLLGKEVVVKKNDIPNMICSGDVIIIIGPDQKRF